MMDPGLFTQLCLLICNLILFHISYSCFVFHIIHIYSVCTSKRKQINMNVKIQLLCCMI